MGKNCEERGTLTLPSAAVVPLRNALVDAINKQREEWFGLAVKVHAHLKSDAGTGDRKVLSSLLRGKQVEGLHCRSADDFVSSLADKMAPKPQSRYGRAEGDDESYERSWRVARLLVTPATPDGAPRKIQAPKKKDLPQLLQSKTWEFSSGECSVSISPKTRSLEWSVSEGKNAVDHAWESLLGRTLAAELKKVTWTRGTGGAFNYTDEYASEGAMEHGYSPISISHAFGPLGEREQEYRSGIPRKMRPKSR